MVQDPSNNPSLNQIERKNNKSQLLHIAFHNPNTPEETAKTLAKLIAKNLANQAMIGTELDEKGLIQ